MFFKEGEYRIFAFFGVWADMVKSPINQTVGRAMVKWHKVSGLTQAQLAERLNLSLDAVSRLERGNIALTVERLVELAEIFGCETADLLGEGSTRVRDQAVRLESLLERLDEEERVGLLDLVGKMVDWKRG